MHSVPRARCQFDDVGWVEADRGADVDCHQLAALDETLNRPRMHMEAQRSLLGGQKRWLMLGARRGRSRHRTTRGDSVVPDASHGVRFWLAATGFN